MQKIAHALAAIHRKWRPFSVKGRINSMNTRIETLSDAQQKLSDAQQKIERRLSDISKHLEDVNLSLGKLNEHVGNLSAVCDASQIVAAIGHMNNNISELFGCLIEIDRDQKTLLANLTKKASKDS